MQDPKKYIVAVDLGSTHITGAAGHRDDAGRFVVDAVEIVESKDAIKRGRIINVSDVAFRLSQISGVSKPAFRRVRLARLMWG